MDARRFVLILILFITQSHAGRIKLDSDGGYVDMVIAIHDNIPESSDLLDDIQMEFDLASSHLHKATRKMTYFKEIRILIPPSWAQSERYEDITWESYPEADVLIRPSERHVPFVVNYGQCGTPGKYMFLTPEFISDHEEGKNYGRPQKTVIHEFGHLRWGLKDEYPYENDHDGDPRYHHFYENSITKKIEATRCVEAITGTFSDRTDVSCKNSSKDGLPDKDLCYFRIDPSATNYSASFMFIQHLGQVTEFCDEANGIDPGIHHNIHAPNRQNIQCNYQSCWEVMRKHSDFTERKRSTPERGISPSFKLIKEVRTSSVVLVLDTSGSMAGQRIAFLRSAASRAISDVLPFGTRLGMVRFSGSSSVISNIVPILTNVDRTRLSSLLPRSTGGSTSIGSGIRRAVQMLRAESVRTNRKIIVVSDGEENRSPYIRDVMNEVMEANVKVSTIAIGATVDMSFENLASATNGQSFLNSDGLTSLYLSFFQSIRGSEQSETSSGTPVVLETSNHEVQSGSNFTESFYIDEALTGDLKVFISYSLNSAFNGFATLVDPRGTIYNDTSDFFYDETVVRQGNFVIKQSYVEVGRWDLTVVNLGFNDSFEVLVQPIVAPGATPITVSVSWALAKLAPPQRQILYVAVSKDLTPVINARVVATITVSGILGIDKTVVYPLDNGAGADSNKDDGVYSIYFTKFTSTGRYSVQVLVEGKPDTQLVDGAFLGGGSSIPVDETAEGEPIDVSYQPTGLFQREVIGETFVCESQACIDAITMDLYPPTEIMDLSATNVHPDNNTITLTFTAPGDDLSDGSAFMYEFRYSYDFSELVYQFNESEIIPEDWFVLGNTSAPKEAGSEETFVITVNQKGNITYSIAVVAIDDEMNRSQRSNIATSSGSLLFYQPPSRGLSIAVIAGVIAAVLFVFVVVLIIAFWVGCKLKKNRPVTPVV